MIPKYNNLSRIKRQLIFTVILLLFSVLNAFNLAPDFIVAFVAGVLFALILNEVMMFISSRKVN